MEKRKILKSDPIYEIATAKEIDTQRVNVQAAVDEYNKTARVLHIPILQPDQLQYFIPGGAAWSLHMWREMQVVPKSFPMNISRTKYIELLDQPNFGQIDALCRRCNMITPELYQLVGETVVTNEAIAAKHIDGNTIYLETSEEERYELLMKLIDTAHSLGLIRHSIVSNMLEPIDLNQAGVRFTPFHEGRSAYQVHDVPKLKTFLQRVV